MDPRIGDLGPALLALEDGSVFPGVAFGAPVGERLVVLERDQEAVAEADLVCPDADSGGCAHHASPDISSVSGTARTELTCPNLLVVAPAGPANERPAKTEVQAGRWLARC